MKTASKILSMLLLVAMCLSLMGGSAYALAPLEGEGTSSGGTTGSGTVSNGGIYGLAPVDEGNQSSGSDSGAKEVEGNSGTIYGLLRLTVWRLSPPWITTGSWAPTCTRPWARLWQLWVPAVPLPLTQASPWTPA